MIGKFQFHFIKQMWNIVKPIWRILYWDFLTLYALPAGWDPLSMTMATRRRATTSKQSWHFGQRRVAEKLHRALLFLKSSWALISGKPFPRVQPGRLKLNEHFSKMLPNSVKASEKDLPLISLVFVISNCPKSSESDGNFGTCNVCNALS